MNPVTNIPLVIFLGILSTIQTHLAKALERQGIEVFEQIKEKFQHAGKAEPGGLKKPLIYSIGLVLNNTVFIWSILAQPHGPPALFTSMFGVGLVFLMAYAGVILKETIRGRDIAGSVAIVIGTLCIGIENTWRVDSDRFTMDIADFLIALAGWLLLSMVLIVRANRTSNQRSITVAFGLLAGGLGSLDPFFKGIGQNHGSQAGFLPTTTIGAFFFYGSFLVGFLAFVVTQIAFAKKVQASHLVPIYNAAFIGLPVLWQMLLLPNYRMTWISVCGIAFVLTGVLTLQPMFGRSMTLQSKRT